MGRLDVVVSNGGWTRIRNLDDLDQNVDENDWDQCFNINVKSHLFLLHAARKYLDETQGSFVTVASVAGSYSVTKAAQIHMVKCIARAVGPKTRVNSVSPGILMTGWGQKFPIEHLQTAKDVTLLKRVATVEDVAEAVQMLALNTSLTGHNMAFTWHLVSEVVEEPKDLLPAAMHIACGITYTNGAVMRALTQLINLGYGISYSEARELELNIDTKSFEDLRSSREANC
ncbi:hypothetical protein PENANT_c014G11376 [Penicillium antarcticum]|uniref:Uncharacterized protein n=1 Tax=Penicillium antarcticum TaxID=416450 RepID=A0A1V6Q4J1_9EURO|nr:hypothetical protein PENANT_c014G11376 [Penicillium antarcticum]